MSSLPHSLPTRLWTNCGQGLDLIHHYTPSIQSGSEIGEIFPISVWDDTLGTIMIHALNTFSGPAFWEILFMLFHFIQSTQSGALQYFIPLSYAHYTCIATKHRQSGLCLLPFSDSISWNSMCPTLGASFHLDLVQLILRVENKSQTQDIRVMPRKLPFIWRSHIKVWVSCWVRVVDWMEDQPLRHCGNEMLVSWVGAD